MEEAFTDALLVYREEHPGELKPGTIEATASGEADDYTSQVTDLMAGGSRESAAPVMAPQYKYVRGSVVQGKEGSGSVEVRSEDGKTLAVKAEKVEPLIQDDASIVWRLSQFSQPAGANLQRKAEELDGMLLVTGRSADKKIVISWPIAAGVDFQSLADGAPDKNKTDKK
mgnify:FL=1